MKETLLTFSGIVKEIKIALNLSNNDLMKAFSCSKGTLSFYLNNKVAIAKTKAIRFKDYLKVKYNVDVYSYIFKDEKNKLFHASRRGIIGKIDPHFNSKKHLDFSTGFYLGESFKQASTFVAEETSGEDRIYKYTFDYGGLKGVHLSDIHWILYIAWNRGKIAVEQSEIADFIRNYVGDDIDYIYGSIADDRMSQVLEEFFANQITLEQVIKCLRGLNIGNQYCLKTKKAISKLKLVEIYKMDDALRELIKDYAMNNVMEAVNHADYIVSIKEPGTYYRDVLNEYGK